MHITNPIILKTSTPVWNSKSGLFATIDAIGFTSLTFVPESFPVVASLEYQQPIFGNQTLKINGVSVPVNPVANSITNIALIWKTWNEENLKILTDDFSEVTPDPDLIIDKIPVDAPYMLSVSVAYNTLKPNINITNVTGPVDFTLTGTGIGSSGLITFQLLNELFAVNFVNGTKEGNHTYNVGAGKEVVITYIHTPAGLKYFCANPL